MCQNSYPKFLYSAKDTINPVGWINVKGDTLLGMSPRKYRKVSKLIVKHHELTETVDTLQSLKKKLKDINVKYKQIRKLNKSRNEELAKAEKALLDQKKELQKKISELQAKIIGLKIAIGFISGGAATVITIILIVLLI